MVKGIWVQLLKGNSSPMEGPLLETWEGLFENVADDTDDAKTFFFVELMHADFKIDLKIGEKNEKIEVIRWQFPLHAAHCSTSCHPRRTCGLPSQHGVQLLCSGIQQRTGKAAGPSLVDGSQLTVGGLGSEARFQVKKSACFWCHGRYHE